MTRTFQRAIVVAALPALLLAGCGGDGGADTASATTGGSGGSATTASLASVNVSETSSQTSAAVGDRVIWTITAVNNGSGATGDTVSLVVSVPGNVGGIAVNAQGATCGPAVSTLTCTIPPGLAAGAAATVTLTATATTAGSLTSSVSTSGEGVSGCAAQGSCSTSVTVAPAAGGAGSSGGSSSGSTNAVGLVPANGETAAYVDTRLQLSFDGTPILGATGLIKVFNATTGAQVDQIDISGAPVTAGGETQTYMPAANTEIDTLGNNTGLTQWRYVYYTPVTISGNTATIRLHDNMLSNGTKYYVTIDNGVLAGKMNGIPFAGITSPTAWTFTTKAAPASQTAVTVASTGTADFRTVQGALDWIMRNSSANASASKTITIQDGSYNEQLFLRNVNNLTISGQSQAGTIVYQDNSESYNPGTGGSKAAPATTLTTEGSGTRRALGGGRSVLLVEGSDLLKLTNFTLQNSHVRQSNFNNQAEALYYNTSTLTASRMVASFMNFLSAQDTIQTKGWVWYYKSYIAGNVDFIWGSPYAALFEQSELHTTFDPIAGSGGSYSANAIIQARAATGYPGFVVLNSALTADATVPAATTYLARSLTGATQATNSYCTQQYTGTGSLGNAQLYCDTAAYISTKMGTHIAGGGWQDPNTNGAMAPYPGTPTATAGWREWLSMDAAGNALSMSGRDTQYATSAIDLSGLNTTAKVFASFKDGNGASWTPTP